MKERESNELYIAAESLAKTFVHRRDCFAIQSDSGSYYSLQEELTVGHLIGHLKGDLTIAAYLLGTDAKARFAVIDADDEGGLEKLVEVHASLPIPSYVESSRRGGHLWFFFEEPVDGKIARNFGLEIAKRYLIEAEVFPKQAKSEGPGSCIRLPFGVHRKSGERYPFVGLGHWRDQLQTLANPERVPIEEVLKYQYEEPKRKKQPLTPLAVCRREYLVH